MEETDSIKICAPERLLVPVSAASAAVPKWKRGLDVTCIVLTAPVWLPIMLIIGALIKVISPGPIFFRQERIGFRGQRFTCFKFRTMKVNGEIAVHRNHLNELIRNNKPMTKMDAKGDARLIPLARFLRATGLDELPQLLNVLRGEMSLVGPRPCIPYEYECYETWQKRRFEAVPGLTGLWQVSGKDRTTFNEMIQLDVYYAQNCSLWFDLKIMLKTFPAVFSQVKATGVRPRR